MSNWKFFLADSSNLELQKDITGEARDKQISLSYNRSGSCSFTLPLNESNYDNTLSNNKAVVVIKNNSIVWSGPIWSRSIDFNEEKIEVNAVGWFEILMYRIAYAPKTYSSATWTEGAIAFDLLDMANNDLDTWISQGTDTSTTPRTKQIETFMSIGEEIINLSDIEYGFDFYVDPETRELNIKEYNEFADNTNIAFGYNWGPNNVSNFVIEENGGEMRNRYIVAGGDGVAYSYPNSSGQPTSPSQLQNNLLIEVLQLTEQSDSTFLQAVANANGQIKEFPVTNLEISLKPFGKANPYGIYEHFEVGDKIYFTIQKEIGKKLLILEYSPRIFGATINIDEEGREIVSSLQTTFEN